MMGKSEEISGTIPAGVDSHPAARSSSGKCAVDPASSDLCRSVEDSRDHLGNLHLNVTANEQSGTVTVSDEANGDVDSKVEGADVEEEGGGWDGEGNRSENESRIEKKKAVYPLRPEAEDCAFYMKTGNCKFGLNCRFNHPLRRKTQAAGDKVKEKEEDAEKLKHIECKYYLRSGGCKYGDSCRFSHSKPIALVAPVSELNFLGLPIRLGERECPYYMRNGSCKFGADCKFNHPDPTAIGGSDSPTVYGNGGSIGSFSPRAKSQTSSASWSSPRPLNGTSPFMPVMFPQSHGLPSRATEWNGYQASVYTPDRSVVPPAPYLMTNSPNETSIYLQCQPQMPVDEFPERPGQPECSYYLKTGDCKFKYKCKYHHPKNRLPKQPPCSLSDKGLPLRPGQTICAHYSRYGICKFGPACKFDHSVQPTTTSTGMARAIEASLVDASGNDSDGWN